MVSIESYHRPGEKATYYLIHFALSTLYKYLHYLLFISVLLLDFNNISHNSTLIQHSYFSLPMSIESSKVLRNGKVLTDPLSHSSIENTDCCPNLNMESSSNSADEINRSGRNSPTNENSGILANE